MRSVELARVADVLRGQARARASRPRSTRAHSAFCVCQAAASAGEKRSVPVAGVVAVLLEQSVRRPRRRRAAASGVELRVRLAVTLPGERVARDLGQAVQVLGAVVGAEVRAVAPERAVLHEAVLEEDLLPVLDVLPREERRPGRVGHPLGDRRRVRVGQDGDQREHGEAERPSRGWRRGATRARAASPTGSVVMAVSSSVLADGAKGPLVDHGAAAREGAPGHRAVVLGERPRRVLLEPGAEELATSSSAVRKHWGSPANWVNTKVSPGTGSSSGRAWRGRT